MLNSCIRGILTALGVNLLAAVSALGAAAPLPAESYTRFWNASNMRLSPDGQTLAFVGTSKKTSTVFFRDLKTQEMHWINPDDISGRALARLGGLGFMWLSNDRLLLSRGQVGIVAFDRNGKNWKQWSGYDQPNRGLIGDSNFRLQGTLGHVFEDRSERIYLYDSNWLDGTGHPDNTPSVFELNTRTGKHKSVITRHGFVYDWVVDHADRIRFGIIYDGAGWKTIARNMEDAPWRELADLSSPGASLYPLGFSADNQGLFVAKLTDEGTWGVYSYDLKSGKLDGLVAANPHFDMIRPRGNAPGMRLLFSARHQLLGVRFMANQIETVWLDPTLAGVQAAVDRALPDTTNILESWSDDTSRIVVLATSSRLPGTYYFFDRAKGSFGKIGDRAPWINPANMAKVMPIDFKARDGMTLHGYLTIPCGHAPKHLPMVVLLHYPTFARDTAEFNPMVQFLASRGYAVLQVNTRGAPGYGEAYYRAGWNEIGGKIQDDITDGVKAMMAGGVADPKRVAIVGSGFGGYCTLWGMEHSPELYRCGVSVGGFTDWEALLGSRRGMVREIHSSMLLKVAGPGADRARLREISPVNHVDQLRAPVLFVHGLQDSVVSEYVARRFISELKKHDVPHETWLVSEMDRPPFPPKQETELYERIEAFLAKHMK